MINATKKWIFLKVSGATLVPLMIWFILNFIAIYDQAYFVVINFFTSPLSKFLFSLFIINAYFFKYFFVVGYWHNNLFINPQLF